MKAETALEIIVACLPLVAVLLAIAEWTTFRSAQRVWEEQPGVGRIRRWRPARSLAYGGLILLSLASLWVAFYSFWLSFFVPPWQVLWPTAGALVLTGLAGLTTAAALLLKPIRHPIPILVAGAINLVLLVSAETMLMATPRAQRAPDWVKPGVLTGADHLSKRLFLRVDGVGTVTDIQRGELRSPGIVELGIAGNYGARFFDQSGKLLGSVNFVAPKPYPKLDADIVPQTHSHGLIFFRHGAWSEYDSVLDARGKES